jgi:tetratricopeptide (TPR) repeat protein
MHHLGLALPILLMSSAPAATPNAALVECQRAWQDVADQPAGSDAVLAAWKGNEARCKGTGIYEVGLASILTDRNEFDLARQVLQTSTIPENYKKQAEVVAVTIDYLQAVGTGDRARLDHFEENASTFAKANPDAIAVLGMLGHTRVIQQKYALAIAPLESVIQSGNGNLGDHRNLTLAYANSGQYQSALELLDKTYSMSTEVTSDAEFMYAAALAYAASGKVDSAKAMLTLILNKNPELKDDPRFQQTVLKAKELSHGTLK